MSRNNPPNPAPPPDRGDVKKGAAVGRGEPPRTAPPPARNPEPPQQGANPTNSGSSSSPGED
jgi:hypothetical protein